MNIFSLPLRGEEQENSTKLRPAFNSEGLLPAIAQDSESGEVLMLAWMNERALQETLETGRAVYWSRSRGILWRKGDSSGHIQQVCELRLDCDQDAILLKVRQTGVACHTGHRSCFYRIAESGGKLLDVT